MLHVPEVHTPDELPGVRKKSFAMAYAGGEIWFEHLDGMYGYTDLVLSKLTEDARTFQRPSYPSLIDINLDETTITPEVEDTLVSLLTDQKKRFTRVAFVGADKQTQKQLRHKLASKDSPFALKFFNDFEKSKEWLVSEIP